MKKYISLIKVSLNHDMNIFKINTKKQTKLNKIILPLILAVYIMFLSGIYSHELMKMLKPIHLEFITLTMFAVSISLFTLIEGIYKSSSLIFNCTDDNLMFSLPISKRTILFIRMLKFYIFELLFNSLFLLPSIIVYAVAINPSWTYYLSSLIALILLPIIPIALSCIIGFITTSISSKFKGKNTFQTIISMLFLIGFLYLTYNMDGFVSNIVAKATSINEIITKIYYPVGAYISLITNFKLSTFIIYILVHLGVFLITIFALEKYYFKINSNFKGVVTSKKNTKYTIKKNSKLSAFVKKELKRFFSTPVFVTNAGFGLVLYVIACIYMGIRYDAIMPTIAAQYPEFNLNEIIKWIPPIMLGVVSFASYMTSITSSMISLEGKAINILKSLPIKPKEIIIYKVLASLIIIIPCIILGEIFIFIKFKFDLLSIIILLIAAFILPFVSELIGILINLKYPKMDATNDTEVVKQSMSAMIATFLGMGIFALLAYLIYKLAVLNIEYHLIMIYLVALNILISIILLIILNKTCDKSFNNITI